MTSHNPRNANGARRRAIRARVLARDELCWYCKQPVDKTLKTPHPGSPEVHELIPVSRGGSPVLISNTVLTHRRCNQFIGNRTPDELAALPIKQRRTVQPPAPTSRRWL